MDQLIPLTDRKLKIIFDKEIINLFGGKITMGIMEAVREQILDEGIEKGRHKEALEIASEMKKDQFSIEIIVKLTKLSIEEIEAI